MLNFDWVNRPIKIDKNNLILNTPIKNVPIQNTPLKK